MRKVMVRDRCFICGNGVEIIPDKTLKDHPHEFNTEFVITHSGYKQYFHTRCWYGMIDEQKHKYGNLNI